MRVDLWAIALDAPHRVERLWRVLSADERARADRFHTATLRTRFVVARAALRSLLAEYAGIGPASIEFVYSSNGKPSLADGAVDFNLSHSDGLAVFAFARGCRVGIDIEKVRACSDVLAIARRYFAPDEYRHVAALSPSSRPAHFCRLWTRKEAYLKGTGEGLSDDPLARRSPPPPPWQVYDLDPAAGYSGALAAEGNVEPEEWREITGFNVAGVDGFWHP